MGPQWTRCGPAAGMTWACSRHIRGMQDTWETEWKKHEMCFGNVGEKQMGHINVASKGHTMRSRDLSYGPTGDIRRACGGYTPPPLV